MSVQSIKSPRLSDVASRHVLTGVFVGVSVIVALIAFHGALGELVRRWIAQEEYSHGFFIPAIMLWLLWARRGAILASLDRPAWGGLVLILIAAAMQIVGELSAFFLMSQVGFIVALMGIALCAGGYSLLKVTFIPIVFLIFAIPTPYFIDSTLSWQLQLISSQLGVIFIRLFNIPVYLAGNVIDLGAYQLQVVEACSGLRYLYPLLSLGFLAAYLFQGRLWQRAIVFLSTIPITVVMNSIRIGITGLMVEQWGTQAAEGFLHFFEGWIIFLACAALLGAEIYLFARLGAGKGFFQVFYLPEISAQAPSARSSDRQLSWPSAAGLALLCLTTIAVYFVTTRVEVVPERTRFVSFPTQIGPWKGRPSMLQPQEEHVLNLDDYIMSNYANNQSQGVNFYVAYYASQRKGSSPHSPIVCLPGGGWLISKFERTAYQDNNGQTVPFNRAVMEQGSNKQLVYYWFVQRGRPIANEYWSKWYLLTDAIFMNRTDGALIRLITPIYGNEAERDADQRLMAFIRELQPNLRAYLPAETASQPKVAQSRL